MSPAAASRSYSVIIPAYNAARTLYDAITSLLRQTVPPSAIIVVVDGATDATAAVAAAFGDRVTLLTQENRGPAAATDRGIGAARTPLIAGLDADDVWFPEKAERQLARLATRPELDAVFCRSAYFRHGEPPDPAGPAKDAWSRSAMMMRRSAADRMGPVVPLEDPRGLGEMIRWFDIGRGRGLRFEMMPEVLVGRRLIAGSLSAARDPRALLPLIRARLAERSRTDRPAADAADRAGPSAGGPAPA